MYKNYTMNQVILPLNLEVNIPEDDIVRAVNGLVESIPDDIVYQLEQKTGRPAYHPKLMLKAILYAYTQSVFSGRKIERMMSDSIRMMWLTHHDVVSYRTINRFRVNEHTASLIQECFIQFRSQLVQSNLIDNQSLFIDGTKIEANANKFSFVWRKSIERYDQNLKETSQLFYEELYQNQILPSLQDEHSEEGLTLEQLKQAEMHLANDVSNLTETIENTKDKKVTSQLKKKRRTLKKYRRKIQQDFIPRKKKYEEALSLFGTRNSFSKTDNDATFMRMKDDYMKNGQLKAGYNLQIATENQFTLAYQLFPNPTDTRTLPTFLATYQEWHQTLPEHIVADAGYGSEANYQHIIDDLDCTPLITYSSFYKESKKKMKKDIAYVRNWQYIEKEDLFICPNKRPVTFKRYSKQKDSYGFMRDTKVYECEDCRNCPLRSQCTKAKGTRNRQVHLNPTWEYFKSYIQEKLSEEETGKIYRQRKIDVEPVFGFLKANLGFTRFHVRGHQQVTNETGLALMAVNLRKLAVTWGRNNTKIKISWRFSVILNFTKIFLFSKGGYVPPSFYFQLKVLVEWM